MTQDDTNQGNNFKVTVDHIASYAIFTMDLKGNITSWNEGARNTYGWNEDEIVGQPIGVLYSAEDRKRGVPENNLKLLKKQNVFEDELRQQKKDTSIFVASVTINPFMGGKTNRRIGYLQITKDVTDRNKREDDQISDNSQLRTEIERRKVVERQLNLSNQELDAFASAAAHDLQEPLRMVVSYLQLIERRYEPLLDQDGKDFLHFAVDGAERMKALISDLVEYSRIDKIGKEFEWTDSNMVLQRVLSNIEVIVEENNAKITHDPLPVVWSEAIQLSQIFQNLLINAIKFKGEDDPVIHVSAKETAHDVIFMFKDNGRGIEKRHVPLIFLIFKQLGDRADRRGSGVGLAIVKKIATRHKGDVWVESKVGKGSTFYISIPKHKEQ
jgi:PAS domain S-box-containing protein